MFHSDFHKVGLWTTLVTVESNATVVLLGFVLGLLFLLYGSSALSIAQVLSRSWSRFAEAEGQRRFERSMDIDGRSQPLIDIGERNKLHFHSSMVPLNGATIAV